MMLRWRRPATLFSDERLRRTVVTRFGLQASTAVVAR